MQAFSAADAAGYERQMGRWSRRLAVEFAEFIGTSDSERILDVGCGTGHLAAVVVSRTTTSTVVGVDLAVPYVDHAAKAHVDPRLCFKVGDACALPFASRSFDRVLALLVLHLLPRPLAALAEMQRVARAGAVVGAAVWDLRGGMPAGRVFLDTAAALDPAADAYRALHLSRPMTRPGELGAAWRSAGLLDVVETALAVRMEYTCFDDYWSPYDGLDGPAVTYLATLTTERKNFLKDAVRRAYLDGEPDGPRSFAAIAWAVKGRTPSAVAYSTAVSTDVCDVTSPKASTHKSLERNVRP